LTRGIAIALALGLGLLLSTVGGYGSMRPAAARQWLERRLGRAPSELRVELGAAAVAILGIFLTIVAVIFEIWLLQGTPLV
jgi:hypothetical protein